jgi:hypothetical protein
MVEIRRHIRNTAPAIIPYFDNASSNLWSIQDELCGKIASCIKAIADSATHIHPLFVKTVHAELLPHFQEALKIEGEGKHVARLSYLQTSIAANYTDLFSTAYGSMEAEYKRKISSLQAEVETAAKDAVSRTSTYIGLLLNNLQAQVSENDRTVLEAKVVLQNKVKELVTLWGLAWQGTPELNEGQRSPRDAGYPHESVET